MKFSFEMEPEELIKVTDMFITYQQNDSEVSHLTRENSCLEREIAEKKTDLKECNRKCTEIENDFREIKSKLTKKDMVKEILETLTNSGVDLPAEVIKKLQ